MKSFNEWKNTNENVNLRDADRQEVWNIVHGLGPILKPELKKLIAKITSDFERNQMQGFSNGRLLDIATSQILLDLTRDYDPMQN
jgi:hypothetical protein